MRDSTVAVSSRPQQIKFHLCLSGTGTFSVLLVCLGRGLTQAGEGTNAHIFPHAALYDFEELTHIVQARYLNKTISLVSLICFLA